MRNFPEATRRLSLSDSDVRELAQVLEFVYEAAIFQLDEYFGRFLDAIRRAGLYDDSLIAFTADHGEIGYRENALYKWTHGLQLAPEVLYVPLIVRGPPGLLPPGRYPGITRSVDVYPTLAALSDVAIPQDAPMVGIDLSRAIRGEIPPPDLIGFSHTSTLGGGVLGYYRRAGLTLALSRIPRDDVRLVWVGARRGDLAYKSTFDGESWDLAVFDHSRDPGETRDLFEAGDPEQQEMFEKLRAYKRLLVTAASAEPQRLSPAEIENLRALGYTNEEMLATVPLKFISAEGAADRILKGVQKNKSFVVFPFYARLAWWIYRIHPNLLTPVNKALAKKFRRIKKPVTTS